MKCQRCGKESVDLVKGLCQECRQRMVLPCFKCGALPAPEDRNCPRCGANLAKPKQEANRYGPILGTRALQVLVSFVLALILVSVFWLILSGLLVEGALKRFFFPGGLLLTSVLMVIVLLFSWGALLCFIRTFRHQRILPHVKALRAKLSEADNSDLQHLLDQSRGLPPSLAESLACIFRRWRDTQDFSETRAIANAEADAHAERSEGINNLVALFIWGIPVLGFMGTVLGIALAVGNFSTFLGGNIDDVAQIKGQLIEVTKGLAFAFNATLLGLLCAFLLMMVNAFARGVEQRLLQEISTLCTRDLLLGLCKPAAYAEASGR